MICIKGADWGKSITFHSAHFLCHRGNPSSRLPPFRSVRPPPILLPIPFFSHHALLHPSHPSSAIVGFSRFHFLTGSKDELRARSSLLLAGAQLADLPPCTRITAFSLPDCVLSPRAPIRLVLLSSQSTPPLPREPSSITIINIPLLPPLSLSSSVSSPFPPAQSVVVISLLSVRISAILTKLNESFCLPKDFYLGVSSAGT